MINHMSSANFPKIPDYPPDLLAPKVGSKYGKIIESSGIAYFYGNPIARFLFKRRLFKTLKFLGDKKYQSLLDAGTGIGYFLPALASIADKVEAIDYHPESLEVARFMLDKRNISNVNLIHGDILRMPYPDQSFDAVICLSAFEHIENLDQAFSEIKRVLKPEGILIAGYPMEDWLTKLLFWLDRRTFFRKYQPAFAQSMEKGEIVWHVSSWQKIDAGLASEFKIEKKEYISIIPLIGRVYALRLAKKI